MDDMPGYIPMTDQRAVDSQFSECADSDKLRDALIKHGLPVKSPLADAFRKGWAEAEATLYKEDH